MKDITSKQITLRTAAAEGKVLCSQKAIDLIRTNSLPKGDLFNIAKAAAMLAAKNTSNLIPHCHPVAIEGMSIEFETFDSKEDINLGVVKISVEAKSIGRTGIEMEVLTAVSVAALTIYDLLKPVDKNLSITDIILTNKKGGKSDKKFKVKQGITAAILVCSDSTAEGKREDKSGLIIKEMLLSYGVEIADYKIVPDEKNSIQNAVKDWVGKDAIDVYREKEKPLTIDGFECWCYDNGIISDLSQYFANTEQRYTEYQTICSRIKKAVRTDQIEGGMSGIYNPSITQRLNNLVEKTQTDVKVTKFEFDE